MVSDRINLNKRQVEFVIYMTEIEDPMKAIKKFADIMTQEKATPVKMPEYINIIIERFKGK
jgi:hypothetical protein